MLLKCILTFYLCTRLSYGVIYDTYTGCPATEDHLAYFKEKNVLNICTVDIASCSATERRRLDGSCNSLHNPAKGTRIVPQPRLLPTVFYNGSYPRKAVSGEDLTSPRNVRLYMLKEGKSSHNDFTHFVTAYGMFTFNDVGNSQDSENLILFVNHCCQEEHMKDYECTPNIIDADDPIHRFSGIRCMNSTRPLSFQYYHCTNDTDPVPIVKGTSAFDLSNIYYTHKLNGDGLVRSFVGGQLTTEEEDGKSWPPNGATAYCPMNQGGETRCFKNYFNTMLPITLLTVLFMRNHNYIATQLADVNPCWDDNHLFETARDINIASAQQIYFYEWLVALQGYENLVKSGVISNNAGFRDLYDKNAYPEVTMEYTYALRWFHTMQESTIKMYDTNGVHLKDFPMLNITFRPGFLAKDNNIAHLTQGLFRQPCRNTDHSIDYEFAEHGFPGLQRSLDITAGDVNKGRHFGMAPYIDYLYLFTGHNITCFDDLAEHMPKTQITLLRRVYEHVKDIDLIAGLWSENLMKGGKIPYTLACILNDTLRRALTGDRHWYERPNRPYAFTKAQLLEIRKMTLASLVCKVGDGVTQIQKKAFFNISPKNPLVSCSDIPKIDFSVWADAACN